MCGPVTRARELRLRKGRQTNVTVSRRKSLAALGAIVACGGPRIEVTPRPRLRDRIATPVDPTGPIAKIDEDVRWAFAEDGFEPMPMPLPDDWLATHPEEPQSYPVFELQRPNRPTPTRRTLVVTRIGPEQQARPTTDEIVDYLAAFFTLPVVLERPVALEEADLSPRTGSGGMQLHTGSILDALEPVVPDHAFALLAVTARDLYPDPAWNFVFGMARLHARVGVFSLARYDPRFDGGVEAPALALRRGLIVLSHEVGHMFGISHCVHYRCVMNGFNNLLELDRTPMQLCRVCLRKLHATTGFDPAARYVAVRDRLTAVGLSDEVPWISARLASAG